MRRRRRTPRLSACACVLAAVVAVATPHISAAPAVDTDAMRLNSSELPPPSEVNNVRKRVLKPPSLLRNAAVAHGAKQLHVRTATAKANSKPKLRAQPLLVLNVTRTRPKRPTSPSTPVTAGASSASVTTTPTAARIVADVELDQLIIAVLAMLALYCFVALRRGGRAHAQQLARSGGSGATAGGGPLGATTKARGATRAQIERHLAHTTVTLYDGTCTVCPTPGAVDTAGGGGSAAEKFDQQQCAICLELLCKPLMVDAPNSVRILPCNHAFHEGTCHFVSICALRRDSLTSRVMFAFALSCWAACIDPWLLRNTQCPLCLKQPW